MFVGAHSLLHAVLLSTRESFFCLEPWHTEQGGSRTLVSSRRFEFDARYPHDLQRFFFFWPKISYKKNLIAFNKGLIYSKE